MLKKNREPTSNTAFPPEEVAKITQLYRTMTNQPNAEARHPRRFSFLDVNKLLRPRISPYMQAPRLLSKKDVEIARAFANGNWELGFRMTNFLGVIRSSPHDSFFYENIKALEESCRERLSTVNPDNPGNPFEQEVVNNPFRLEEIPRIVTENPEDSRVLLDLFKYLVEDVKPEHISLSRWLWSFSGFRVPYWFERFVASTNINPSPSIGWPDVKAVMKRIINRYETETEQLSHQATNIASKENPDIASLIQTFYDPKAAQQDISERAKYKAYLASFQPDPNVHVHMETETDRKDAGLDTDQQARRQSAIERSIQSLQAVDQRIARPMDERYYSETARSTRIDELMRSRPK